MHGENVFDNVPRLRVPSVVCAAIGCSFVLRLEVHTHSLTHSQQSQPGHTFVRPLTDEFILPRLFVPPTARLLPPILRNHTVARTGWWNSTAIKWSCECLLCMCVRVRKCTFDTRARACMWQCKYMSALFLIYVIYCFLSKCLSQLFAFAYIETHCYVLSSCSSYCDTDTFFLQIY